MVSNEERKVALKRACKTRKPEWRCPDRVRINSVAATRVSYGFLGGVGAGCEVGGACCVVGCEPAGVCDVGCEAPGAGPGVVAGVVAGTEATGFGAGCETFCRIELPCPTALSLRSTNAMAQSMNMMAHHVVAFERTLAAPRGPKAVWLPAPPNAPAKSAALPLCSSTTMISTRQLITKNVGKMKKSQGWFESFQPKTTMPRPIASAIPHFNIAFVSIPYTSRE